MLKMEYDEAKTMAHIREDSYEEGEQAGLEKGKSIGLKKVKNKMVINIINEGDSIYSVEYVEN